MKRFNKDKYLRKLKFKRYWQTNSRYFYIGIPCLLCLVLGIYFAYSKFFVTGEEEVIRTTVGEFIYGDIIMTPYIDGQYSNTFPEKKTGINVEKVVCDNEVTASWDEDKWGLYATNLSKRTKCSVYFVTPNSCGVNDNVSCINSRDGLTTLSNTLATGDTMEGKIVFLTADIDLGGKFDSEGNALDGNINFDKIYNVFSGTFDGNGHLLKNMYIISESDAALFVNVRNATIKNLGIENSYIESKNSSANALAVNVENSNIYNIYIDANLKGAGRTALLSTWLYKSKAHSILVKGIINSNNQFGAGLIGYASTSKIFNSYNLATINGNVEVGGVVGGVQRTEIYNCYNLGNVSGQKAGGIVGQMHDPTYPIVHDCYNTGTISGSGIVGNVYENENKSKLFNNYYLSGTASYGAYTSTTNQTFDDGAEKMLIDEMPSVISVINGDNAFVEDTNNINNGYPILKWQAERENN